MMIRGCRVNGLRKLKRFSYIITYRETDRYRRRNIGHVLNWLKNFKQPPEVIVVEQDARPVFGLHRYPRHWRSLFAYNPLAFNKSWAFNLGAKLARYDTLVFGDADMIMNERTLVESVQICQKKIEAMSPYQYLVELTDRETAAVCNGFDPAHIERKGIERLYPRGNERLCFCGGLFIVRRSTYLQLGGMDERFQGWGGEDDAMSIMLKRFCRCCSATNGQYAYHLWHPRPGAERTGHGRYEYHTELVQAYLMADDYELRQLTEIRQPLNADINRYQGE